MKRLLRIFKIQREERPVALLAAVLFGGLLALMLHYANLHYSAKLGFSKYFVLSGFDSTVWSVMRDWRLSYSVLRHPLLDMGCWPLSVLNGWLTEATGTKCMMYITAVLWWVMDVYSFIFIHRTMRRGLDMGRWASLLLTVMFFSIGYVMVASFAPDHMAITMCILSATLCVSALHIKAGTALRARTSLILFTMATGVTTTNGLKIMLSDFFTLLGSPLRSLSPGRWTWAMVRHFMYYIIPAVLLFGAYCGETEYIQKPQQQRAERIKQQKMKKDAAYAQRMQKIRSGAAKFKKKQVAEGKLFEFTDATVDRWPSLTENVFGEGLQLHDRHVLQDCHGVSNRRPLFVDYSYAVNYVVEVLLVLLLVGGIIAGLRHRLMWVPLSWFLLDMLVHIGFKFAINDVYIMTAHWAMVFPVAWAFLLRWTKANAPAMAYKGLAALMSVLTLWLLCWNINWIVVYMR